MPGLYYRQSTPVNNVGIQLSNHFHISHFTPTVCSYLEEREKRLKKKSKPFTWLSTGEAWAAVWTNASTTADLK